MQSLEFVGLNIFETGAVMLVEDESHGRSKHLCGASPERDFFQDGNANTDVNIVESTCTQCRHTGTHIMHGYPTSEEVGKALPEPDT